MSIQINDNGSSLLTLLGVRGSFLKFTKPEAVKAEPNGKKRYSLTVMIPKSDTAMVAEVNQAIEAVKKANPKVKWFASNIMLKDGDKDEKKLPEYAGHWFFSAARSEEQGPPDLYGKKASAGKLSIEDANKLFYPGCMMNLKIGVYKPGGWDKVCASIELAQFAGDGERLAGGARASADDLPDIDEDETEDMPAGMMD